MRRLASLAWRSTVLRFLAVGSIATLFQLLLVAALVGVSVAPFAANVIAFVASTQVNFTLSAAFTWRHRRVAGTARRRWVRYNSVAAVGLLLNSAVFLLLRAFGLEPVESSAGAVLVSTGATYLLSRVVVFTTASRPVPIPPIMEVEHDSEPEQHAA